MLEESIKAKAYADDIHAQAVIDYRAKRLERIKYHREQKTPITIMLDIIRGELVAEKKAVMDAERDKGKLRNQIDLLSQRLNNRRFYLRKKEESLKI